MRNSYGILLRFAQSCQLHFIDGDVPQMSEAVGYIKRAEIEEGLAIFDHAHTLAEAELLSDL